MAIIYQHDKRSGITYAYDSKSYYEENEVRELNYTNKKLEKRLNTNFENSSLPSSALPFRKKIPNNRKPTGRKPEENREHKPDTKDILLPDFSLPFSLLLSPPQKNF